MVNISELQEITHFKQLSQHYKCLQQLFKEKPLRVQIF